MSPITTHVLDTSRGRPAAGVAVELRIKEAGGWRTLGRDQTDADGRLKTLLADAAPLSPAIYEIVYDTRAYFPDGLYPEVKIVFEVREPNAHYHIPLLLSPFGYTTYRGS